MTLVSKPFDPNTPYNIALQGVDADGVYTTVRGTWAPQKQDDMLTAKMEAAVVLARKAGLARIHDGTTQRGTPPIGLPSLALNMHTSSVADDDVTLDAVRAPA